jgi:hypothetical protein
MDTRTYFAKVENNIVTDVRVVAHDFIVANPGRYGDASLWIETFYDNSQRGKYAAIGDLYDPALDIFTSPPVEDAPE